MENIVEKLTSFFKSDKPVELIAKVQSKPIETALIKELNIGEVRTRELNHENLDALILALRAGIKNPEKLEQPKKFIRLRDFLEG